MKTLKTFIQRPAALLLAIALPCLLALGACVTAPDEAPWQDVAAYSWPTATGTLMRYRVEEKELDTVYTLETTTEASNSMYEGKPMFRLHDDHNVAVWRRLLYLPLKDTLVAINEEFGGLPAYLLVAPLEKGHSWISGYSDTGNTQPSWRATIIDRYSYLQLEGESHQKIMYRNVVVVKYEPVDKKGDYWLRFYAQDKGPIQTIQHLAQQADSSFGVPVSTESQTIKRTVLLDTTPAQN